MFSSRVRHVAQRNRLAIALDARRAAGAPIIDLTMSNPTRAGFMYPSALIGAFAQDSAVCYDPQPLGLRSAREAVSADFGRRGILLPPDRIVLTTSTSEAYSLLFKLLCDPGDTVFAPRPSYPLVEHLTGLDAVSLEHFNLEYHGRWAVDVEGLKQSLPAQRHGRTRAIIMISPNNPTGSTFTTVELEAIAALAREHRLALISDEVFADYSLSGAACPTALSQHEVLTFVLGGLSKSIGLPQAKLGWIGVGGPDEEVAEALDRLETICDAYLSVSTVVQVAAPNVLKRGADVRGQIQRRIRDNFALLVEIACVYPSCSVLPAEAGWSAIIQVPSVRSEETLVLELLERTGILVHPGYFFDFEREAFLVISLLPETASFSSALHVLFGEIGRLR